jgi:hypothetical protein
VTARVRRARRPGILDQAVLESGAEVYAETMKNAELARRLGEVTKIPAEEQAAIMAWLRQEAINRRDVLLEMGQAKLQDPVSATLARLRAPREPGEQPPPRTKLAETVEQAGDRPIEPVIAVTSPRTVARIVEAIYAREPKIRAWFEQLGLSVEDGTWLMCRVLDYTKPRDIAAFRRRVDRRGGVLWELLMPFKASVVQAEREVALGNAIEWVRAEPARFGVKPAEAEALVASVQARFAAAAAAAAEPRFGQSIVRTEDNPGLGGIDFIAENLWMMRLTGVHDESGRLMMDHYRALVSFAKDGSAIDLTPVGIGESKFGSKAAEMFEQMVRNVGRASETLRAADLPNPSVLPVRVRSGKTIVVIGQTEAQRGVAAPADLQASLRATAGRKDLNVVFMGGQTLESAQTSRSVVEAFMRLVAKQNLGAQ